MRALPLQSQSRPRRERHASAAARAQEFKPQSALQPLRITFDEGSAANLPQLAQVDQTALTLVLKNTLSMAALRARHEGARRPRAPHAPRARPPTRVTPRGHLRQWWCTPKCWKSGRTAARASTRG